MISTSENFFPYYEYPQHDWQEKLENYLAQDGVFQINIPWGIHETAEGVRDFTKGHRLKLERLFTIATERNHKVHVTIGFGTYKNAFPEWVQQIGDRLLVPRRMINKAEEPYTFCSVPSLYHLKIRRGFLDFIDEVSELLALYRTPEGPIERIKLDLSFFHGHIGLAESGVFASEMESRYGDIKKLNFRYGSNFNDFVSLKSISSLELMASKRPWLFAFDYQAARQSLMSLLLEEIQALEFMRLLAPWVTTSFDDQSSLLPQSPWAVVLDPYCVEKNATHFVPSTLEGLVQDSAASAFRLYDFIVDRAKVNGVPVFFLPSQEENFSASQELLVVLCGKYLSVSAYEFLKAFLRRGGQVLFPLFLPQYNENLECLDWPPQLKTAHDKGLKVGLKAGALDRGLFWVSSRPLDISNELWKEIEELSKWIRTKNQEAVS